MKAAQILYAFLILKLTAFETALLMPSAPSPEFMAIAIVSSSLPYELDTASKLSSPALNSAFFSNI